ncbi:MAG: hypothetical protein L3K15_04800 [Thermoplasmata archaeon]|nr:hypothetical protein [Thermoplasmata archaeon]
MAARSGLVAIVLLCVSFGGPILTGHPPLAPPVPPLRAAVTPEVTTSPHGNILIHSRAPQGAITPGMVLSVEYRLAIVNDTPSIGAVPVRVPGTLASFPTQGGPLFLFQVGRNVTLSGTGFSDPNATNSPQLLTNASAFQTGETATFDTQLAALMTPFPYGQLTLEAQWQWTLTAQDGSHLNGSWSPTIPQVIHPAQYAYLVSIGPAQVAPGGGITSCLGGSIVNRTFSLHAETVHPLNDFVQNTNTVPATQSSPFCQTIVIPSSVPPQPLIVHIWDYGSVTLLLYIVKVGLLNASKLNGSGPAALPWVYYVDGGALAVGGGIVLWMLAGRRPGRPTAPAAESDAPMPEGPPR